ncbi:YaeQ family protein [Pseudoalteromonas rubra]|uniref:YaeQ family protein n=1 Tax=Pseudoalteromonas rubra TaxID=43658 RepID=A0A5S3WYJ0_9GAMM|nr:YaeQ family protein [Pseudoalteromonas rubra]TMP34804.1 hypothetical protein CWB98_17575 [Pseudoalteromonas rubra]
MALKSTILKANLSLSDMDRHVYQDISVTLAQHPSENAQRVMVRLLAFALEYQDGLSFSKGLCVEDEPDIWLKNYSDEIELWLSVGLPEEKWLKKASNRSKQVVLYTYGENNQGPWWQKNRNTLRQYTNLKVISLPYSATSVMAEMLTRTMALTVTVQDSEIWFSDEQHSVHLIPETLQG